MLTTAAASHPGGSGRLLYVVPEGGVQVWLLLRQSDTPEPAALLRLWLTELLGHPPALAHTDAGKPFIPDSTLHFNVSHSPRWFVMGWRVGPESVGVDVEDLDRRPRVAALAERYFHDREKARWLATDTPSDASAGIAVWLTLWTRKEAVLKAHGMGLRLQLNTLDTCRDAVQHPVLGDWQLHSFHLPDAVVSVSWPTRTA